MLGKDMIYYNITKKWNSLHFGSTHKRLYDFFLCTYPSGFFIENGWGGRIINPTTWVPHETNEGPSFWGHERLYLPDDERLKFRKNVLKLLSKEKITYDN